MDNVARIGDENHRRGNNNNNGPFGGFLGSQQGNGNNNPYDMFGSSRNRNQDPREETFWDMMVNMFCPQLKKNSFTVFTIITMLTIYVLTLLFDGIKWRGSLLETNVGFFIKTFSTQPPKIAFKNEIWRLISSLFIHSNLVQIVTNLVSLFFWGTLMEHLLTTKVYTVIYLLSGKVFF